MKTEFIPSFINMTNIFQFFFSWMPFLSSPKSVFRFIKYTTQEKCIIKDIQKKKKIEKKSFYLRFDEKIRVYSIFKIADE